MVGAYVLNLIYSFFYQKKTTLLEVYKNALLESTFKKRIEKIQKKLQINPNTPFTSLPDSVQQLVFYGKPTHGITQTSIFDI